MQYEMRDFFFFSFHFNWIPTQKCTGDNARYLYELYYNFIYVLLSMWWFESEMQDQERERGKEKRRKEKRREEKSSEVKIGSNTINGIWENSVHKFWS